jgi:hypothetical protein
VRKLRYDERFNNNNIAHWKILKDIENGSFVLK